MFNPEGFSTQLADAEAPPLTAQSLFDTTLVHLVAQGQPSIGLSGICRYRQDDLRCAVGVHILDHEYQESMEGKGVFSLIETGLLPERLFPFRALLEAMQTAHDAASEVFFLHYLLYMFEGVARDFCLNSDTIRALSFSIEDLGSAEVPSRA